MPRQFKISSIVDLPPGEMKLLSLGGVALAVFNINGRYYAIRNRCPHEGGPVASGPLKGTMVTCPRHGWKFDLATGESPNHPAFMIKTYPVVAKDDALYVEVAYGS